MISDSDISDDLLTNNGVFQNGSTIVSVEGPNVDMTNITGLSFGNNVFSSTMQMPFGRPNYRESSYNQRSLSNRREVSPLRSAYNTGHSNYSFNFRELGARSVSNGRSRCPMSVRTKDTFATVGAGDIIQAIRHNEHLKKHEIKEIITEARNRLRKDGYDSDEMGSNSSLSDDNRCTVTSNFKRKMSSNIFHNHTGNFRFNPDRNAPRGQMNRNTSQTSFGSSQGVQGGAKMSSVKNMPLRANFNTQEKNAPIMLLNDRFNSGYRQQSQRFNKSTISSTIPENVENGSQKETHTQNGYSYLATNYNNRNNIGTDSDEDQPNNCDRKRSMEGEDTFQPNQKRFKPLSSCKKSIEGLKNKKLKSYKGKSNDQTENLGDESNSTNLSMKPSFNKKKLFTQTLDITEKRNLSADNLDSPQSSVYGAIHKERRKARKLQQATTLLSRDVEKDGSNLLDLIQKVVPLYQMNATKQTNKTASQSKNITEEDDNWDIPTNPPRKNADNVSDLYTEEEILSFTVKEPQKSSKKNKDTVKKDAPMTVSPAKTKSCKINIEKLPASLLNDLAITKHFWDADFESDLEFPSPKIDKLNVKENQKPDIVPPKEPTEAQGFSSNLSSKRPVAASGSSQNYTFDTTQNKNLTIRTLRKRSHYALKRNKLDHKLTETQSTLLNNTERKQEKDQVNNCIKVSYDRPKELTKIENKKLVEKTSKGKKKENIATEKDNNNNNKSPKSKKREESVTRKENKNSAKTNKQDTSTKNLSKVSMIIPKPKIKKTDRKHRTTPQKPNK